MRNCKLAMTRTINVFLALACTAVTSGLLTNSADAQTQSRYRLVPTQRKSAQPEQQNTRVQAAPTTAPTDSMINTSIAISTPESTHVPKVDPSVFASSAAPKQADTTSFHPIESANPNVKPVSYVDNAVIQTDEFSIYATRRPTAPIFDPAYGHGVISLGGFTEFRGATPAKPFFFQPLFGQPEESCDEWACFCKSRNLDYDCGCSCGSLKANPGHLGIKWLRSNQPCEATSCPGDCSSCRTGRKQLIPRKATSECGCEGSCDGSCETRKKVGLFSR